MDDGLVFVYGTLRRGGSNAFRMEGAEFAGMATVRGRLYPISWYPGLVLDAEAGPVTGELFRVGGAQLAALDAFEGEDYRRVKAEVFTEDGRSHAAWLWEWILSVEGRIPLAGGDWLEHCGT